MATILNNEVFAGYRALQTQPFLLGVNLARVGLVPKLTTTHDGREFVTAAGSVSAGAIALIEWIRSRILGYPQMLVPHIDARGPYSDRNCMPGSRFPWFFDIRRTGIQLEFTPPRELSAFGISPPSSLLGHTETLILSLRRTPEWRDFESARSALSEETRASLRAGRDMFWRLTSDEIFAREVGNRTLRRQEFLFHALENARAELSEDAAAFWALFERLDSLQEDVWRVIAHFAFYDQPATVNEFSSLEWGESGGYLRISLTASPWTYNIGDLVLIPPSVVPGGRCALVSSVQWSFADGTTPTIIELRTLAEAWPHLAAR